MHGRSKLEPRYILRTNFSSPTSHIILSFAFDSSTALERSALYWSSNQRMKSLERSVRRARATSVFVARPSGTQVRSKTTHIDSQSLAETLFGLGAELSCEEYQASQRGETRRAPSNLEEADHVLSFFSHQLIPDQDRTEEDGLLFALVKTEKWRRCSKCKMSFASRAFSFGV